MKRIRRNILMATMLSSALLFNPVTAFAIWNPFGGVDCGKAADSAVCQSQVQPGTNPIAGPNGIIVKATNFVALIAGIAAIIVLIVAGLKYVTARGDPKEIGSAKETIIYALIGLVVIIAARALITFVVSSI